MARIITSTGIHTSNRRAAIQQQEAAAHAHRLAQIRLFNGFAMAAIAWQNVAAYRYHSARYYLGIEDTKPGGQS